MPFHSKNKKALILIIAPPVTLIVTLFLKVAVHFYTFGTAFDESIRIIDVLLNFIALISVISMLVTVPVGIILLVKKGDQQVVIGHQVLAGRGERLAAKIIDNLIVYLPLILISILTSGADGTDSPEEGVFFWLVLLIFFAVQAYLLTTQGQTIAKRWLKLRIIDMKTQKAGGFVKNVLLRSVVNGIFGIVPLYSLIDAMFIFRDDHRCVHDLLAGTIVIKDRGNSHPLPGKQHCTHCGARTKVDAQFCVKCGKKL